MCDNILEERNRVGGDWVVAQAVPSRKLRDLIRSKLGADLVFVVLNLDKDLQQERLRAGMKMVYEPAEDDEENAVDLKVARDMQVDDVVSVIMSKVN